MGPDLITLLLPGLLVGLLVLTAFAGPHKKDPVANTRLLWGILSVALIEVTLLPSWPLRLLLLGIAYNVLRVPSPYQHKSFLETTVAVVGAYLLLTPYVTTDWIPIVLGTLAGIGALLGLQTLFSFYYVWKHGYWLDTPKMSPNNPDNDMPCLYNFMKQVGLVTLQWWEVALTPGGFICGQLMPNWLHAMACLGVASAVGLTLTGQTWAWALTPFTLVPILATVPCGLTRKFRMAAPPNQCALHLIMLAVALMWVISPWLGFNALLVVVATIVAVVLRQYRRGFPLWIDSGRLDEWYNLMKYWVLLKMPTVYLFGHGTRSWIVLSNSRAQINDAQGKRAVSYFSMAHNEYIQHLFEYGVVGTVALVWYIGHLLLTAYTTHKGLFVVYVTMLSIASVSFPWSYYHVIKTEGRNPTTQQIEWVRHDNYGSVFLFWCSFVLAVLCP